MFKKSFAAIMALMLTIFVTGCGGGDTKKAAENVPQFSADKAIMDYAEMYAFGVSNHLNEAGLTEADTKGVSDKIVGDVVNSFSAFPLSDDNIANMTGIYVDKLEKAMELKTTLKKDDPEAPVVTLSAKIIDQQGAADMATKNEDILALGATMGTLQNQGFSIDDLKANEEFQKTAMDAIGKFLDAIPFTAEKSIDVTCEKVQGSDGKIYWAPKDPTEVAKFVQGN